MIICPKCCKCDWMYTYRSPVDPKYDKHKCIGCGLVFLRYAHRDLVLQQVREDYGTLNVIDGDSINVSLLRFPFPLYSFKVIYPNHTYVLDVIYGPSQTLENEVHVVPQQRVIYDLNRYACWV